MTDRAVEVDGVKIVYTDRGQGAPVLLMHGNPDTRHSWEPLLGEMGEGLRFIAPDFPGFGDSAPIPDGVPFTPAFMAQFWNHFADAIGLDVPANVVVHDFGGPWLLPWVTDHPERVRSLFVLNTLFHRDYPWHSWARLWQRPLIGEVVVFCLRRTLMRREMRLHAPGVPADLVDEGYDRMHATMRRTLLRSYRAYARPDIVFDPWEERLLESLSDKPVRVLWGDLDPYIPSRFAERCGGQVTHLPDYGHWLHLENPALVAETLNNFLAT